MEGRWWCSLFFMGWRGRIPAALARKVGRLGLFGFDSLGRRLVLVFKCPKGHGRLLHIVLMYGALRYSLKDLEDAISYKMENVTKKIPIGSGDPILISSSVLLQRIEKVKEFVSRKHGANDRLLKMDVDSKRSQIFV